MWWGIVLIVLGVLLLLDSTDALDIGHVIHKYWPLLFVFWGVSLLLRDRPARRSATDASVPPLSENLFGSRSDESSADMLNYSNVFGDIRVHSTSQSLKGGSISTVFGKTEVDLRGASVTEGESVLHASGVFGDVTILLPRSIACSINATAAVGSVQIGAQRNEGFSSSLNYESPQYVTNSKRLRIRISQVLGKVVVLHG
jgi:predicted membrane protein